MPTPDIYQTAAPVTPGTDVTPGFGFRIACAVEGYFVLLMSDGSRYTHYANVGQSGEDGISVRGVATTGVPSPAGTGVVTVLR